MNPGRFRFSGTAGGDELGGYATGDEMRGILMAGGEGGRYSGSKGVSSSGPDLLGLVRLNNGDSVGMELYKPGPEVCGQECYERAQTSLVVPFAPKHICDGPRAMLYDHFASVLRSYRLLSLDVECFKVIGGTAGG